MNDDENAEYEQDDNEGQQDTSNSVSPYADKVKDIAKRASSSRRQGVQKGAGNTVKKGAKKLGTQVAKGAVKITASIVKGAANLIMMIPLPVWIAIIVLVILVIIVFIVSDQFDAVNSSKNVTQAYIYNKEFYENEENKKVIEDFEKKESMLLFKLSDLDKIYEGYILTEAGKDSKLANMMATKVRDGNKNLPKMPSGAVSLNDQRELFKHILMTQKYDFNNINWKEFSRKNVSGKAITDMKVEKDLGLRYPNDPKKKLEDFTKQLYPYLQTWHIPMAMFSGSVQPKTIDSPKDIAFPYVIISEAGSKIDMNKYIIETYTETVVTEDWGDGQRTTNTTSSTTTKEEYKLGEVFTFDKWFRNKNEFIPYDKSKAPNSSNTSTKNISRQIVRNDNVNGVSTPVAITQTGTKTTTVNTWADKLKGTTDSKGTHYTALDVENFINNNEGNSRD